MTWTSEPEIFCHVPRQTHSLSINRGYPCTSLLSYKAIDIHVRCHAVSNISLCKKRTIIPACMPEGQDCVPYLITELITTMIWLLGIKLRTFRKSGSYRNHFRELLYKSGNVFNQEKFSDAWIFWIFISAFRPLFTKCLWWGSCQINRQWHSQKEPKFLPSPSRRLQNIPIWTKEPQVFLWTRQLQNASIWKWEPRELLVLITEPQNCSLWPKRS